MALFDKYHRKRILRKFFLHYFKEEGKCRYIFRKAYYGLSYPKSNKDLSMLSQRLKCPESALKCWISGLPENEYSYSEFQIKKKSGKGRRKISAPNDKLKELQKGVYHSLLKKSPLVHTSATAYRKKTSIVDNATPHINKDVVINIDLKNFFEHITSDKIYRYWREVDGWDVDSATVLRNICSHNGCLPQGAPTSPALCNSCNYILDDRMDHLARSENGEYTRYADDLTFSFKKFGPKNQYFILREIKSIIFSEGYRIQKKKRVRVQRNHQRQTATGLVVNKKVNLPVEVRKKIRAINHEYLQGTLPEKDKNSYPGYISLLKMVTPQKYNQGNEKLKKSMVTVLFVSSEPTDQASLRLGKERRKIDESIQAAEYRDCFDLQTSSGTRVEDLQKMLQRYKPTIVHFSGHGSSSSEIVFESNDGISQTVPQDALSNLFKLLNDSVKCVVLNACYSEKQASSIAKHIPVVIGMSDAISDDSAVEYSTSFYQALANGLNLHKAHELAKNNIELHGLKEQEKPIFFGNDTQVILN